MSLSTFITNLQSSDSNRKFRWLVGLTFATMAIIIGIWMLTSSGGSSASGDLVRKDDQPTFFGKIAISTGNVVQLLREKTANTINFFSQKFSTTNTVEVKVTDDGRQTTDDKIEIKN